MDAIESIKEYLESSKTDRAVLVDAPWGHGKTHFWKNEIIPLIKNSGKEPVYVSLNGVDPKQIDTKILLQTLPTKLRGGLITNSLNIFSRRVLSSEFSELIGGYRPKSFKNCVICYDDLERSRTNNLSEIWGIINSDIETHGVKVIILTDYSKITGTLFPIIQEKNVSRVVQYRPDIKEVTTSLIDEYKSDDPFFHKVLLEHLSVITDLFDKFSIKNLRTVKTILENLRVVTKHSHEERKSFGKVILFVIVMTNEFSEGNLTPMSNDRIKELDNEGSEIRLVNLLRETENSDEEQNDYWSEFYERYFINVEVERYSFFRGILQFILTGIIDEIQIEKETNLEETEWAKLPEHVYAFNFLMSPDFRMLTQEVFDKYMKVVLDAIKKGKYSVYEYSRISSSLPFYRKVGLLPMTQKEIEKLLFDGMKKSSEGFKKNTYLMANLNAFPPKNSLEKSVLKRIQEIHDSAIFDEHKEVGQRLISLIDMGASDSIKEFFADLLYKPFMDAIDLDSLVSSVFKASNSTLWALELSMMDRYEIGFQKEIYSVEKGACNAFLANLEKGLKGLKKGTIQYYLIHSISNHLADALSK